MTRTLLINLFIRVNDYKSYTEIGCQNLDNNFNKINLPRMNKISVDPDPRSGADVLKTSDEYFSGLSIQPVDDIVFIDGLHHADQVERDIINSMNHLFPGGVIILHDCNPPTEKDQIVPRRHKVWYGDVWRAFVGFRLKYPEVRSYCIDHDCGCGVIHYTGQKIEPGFITDMSWQEFDANRKELLGII